MVEGHEGDRMSASEKDTHGRLVVSPREDLVAGGAAEDFEQRLQALFRRGSRHIVADLRLVEAIDSAGIRAMVRAHSTAQRLSGSFRLANARPRVLEVIKLSRLDSVLECYETLEAATVRPMPWRTLALAVLLVVVAAGLVWLDGWLPAEGAVSTGAVPPEFREGAAAVPPGGWRDTPAVEFLELVSAGLIGLIVTAVQRRIPRDKPMTRSMEQAQVLLCVSGAMMMIIIGSSLARAFGIAGAASIVRFRTPVEDPRDVTILFLLMGLGMACGMGAFGIAGLGMLFLCVALPLLDRVASHKARVMMIEITGAGRDFPLSHVISVFARHGVLAEPREVSQGNQATVKYHTTIPPGVSLEEVSAGLLGEGTHGIKSVEWEPPKKTE
jgi:anti-anti-sigma factor